MNLRNLLDRLDEIAREGRAYGEMSISSQDANKLFVEIRDLIHERNLLKEANNLICERHIALRGNEMVAVCGRRPESD